MSHLRKIRQLRHYTQVAVYIATGIDQSLLSKYERGVRVPTAADLMLLAELYQTSVDYLLERTDVAEPYPAKSAK
jgi:transcriptional regulator with XRE-family HTH domain